VPEVSLLGWTGPLQSRTHSVTGARVRACAEAFAGGMNAERGNAYGRLEVSRDALVEIEVIAGL
jgi:hypothetical protein